LIIPIEWDFTISQVVGQQEVRKYRYPLPVERIDISLPLCILITGTSKAFIDATYNKNTAGIGNELLNK
jgi:hypothetical protein